MPLRLTRSLQSLRHSSSNLYRCPIVALVPHTPTYANPTRRKYHSSNSRPLQHPDPGESSPGATKTNAFQYEADLGFSYGVAASYCGKQHRFNPAIHNYAEDPVTSERWLAGKVINHGYMKGKRTPSGQDASFISGIGRTGAAAFGVADGVGGWIEQRIDSADFAHGICEYMDDACRRFPSPSFSSSSPKDLLHAGYAKVCTDKSIPGGGSTACVGIVDREGNLKAANLGDSGFMHIRLNKVLYVSEHQTHAFNTPFQLSKMPHRILMQIKDYGGEAPISDYPEDANETHHTLRHGDVLVFGTDGVWDNLSSQDLLEVVSDKMVATGAWNNDDYQGITVSRMLPALITQQISLQRIIATGVVEKAKNASMNMRRDSPFAKAVQKQYPSERFSGGKVDDICAVIAVAVNEKVVLEI